MASVQYTPKYTRKKGMFEKNSPFTNMAELVRENPYLIDNTQQKKKSQPKPKAPNVAQENPAISLSQKLGIPLRQSVSPGELERQKVAAKYEALGQGLKNIVDAVAGSKGATINRNETGNVNLEALQYLQDLMREDEYRNQIMEFENALREISMIDEQYRNQRDYSQKRDLVGYRGEVQEGLDDKRTANDEELIKLRAKLRGEADNKQSKDILERQKQYYLFKQQVDGKLGNQTPNFVFDRNGNILRVNSQKQFDKIVDDWNKRDADYDEVIGEGKGPEYEPILDPDVFYKVYQQFITNPDGLGMPQSNQNNLRTPNQADQKPKQNNEQQNQEPKQPTFWITK